MNAMTEAQNRALAGLSPALVAGLRRTVENNPVRGDGAYLSFGKDGTWTFGAENLEITDEDQFIVDVESLSTGYVCWTDYSKQELLTKKKNEKLGVKMLTIAQGEVDYATLPDHGWPWRKQVSFRGRFLNDPYAGRAAVYETSSGGGDDAYAALTAAIMAKLQADVQGGSELAIYPIVSMKSSFYMHKTYGKTYKPVFDIVAWADQTGRVSALALEAAGEQQAVEAVKEEVTTAVETAPVGGPVQRRRRG